MRLSHAIISSPLRLARFEFPVDGSEATTRASRNFERNRAALERRWPRAILTLPDTLPELEWLFTRDSVLSARHIDGRWFNDLSVPERAAKRIFKSLGIAGSTAVLLAPTHAAQIRRVLDLLQTSHALIVVIPGELAAGVISACEDFSAEINAGRLWLACGPDWEEELKAILEGNDGLNPPTTMIRVPGLNAAVLEHVSSPTESLLSLHAKNHKQRIALLHARPRSPQKPARRVCVVGNSFALWNDASQQLADLAGHSSIECVALDTSSPLEASELKLVRTLEGCDALVTANIARADKPGVVPEDLPWTTWVTSERVPACVLSAKDDRLVLADEALRPLALASGWKDAQLTIACEPWRERTKLRSGASVSRALGLFVDLVPVTVPASVDEMSSVKLVWELVEREIIQKPLSIRGEIDAFVLGIAQKVGVAPENVPVQLFRDRLILPMFAREMAIELDRLGIDFTIHGHGWESLPTLARRWRGGVSDAASFAQRLATTSALLDVWPGVIGHPSRRVGLPIVKAWGRSATQLTQAIRQPGKPPETTAAAFDLAIAVR